MNDQDMELAGGFHVSVSAPVFAVSQPYLEMNL
jgi:hypothetical protein